MVSLLSHVGKLSQSRASFLVYGGVEKRDERTVKHRGLKSRSGTRIRLGTRKKALKQAKDRKLKTFLSSYSAANVLQFFMISIFKMQEWLNTYEDWRNFILQSYQTRFNEMLETIDTLAFMKMDERLFKC